MSQCSEPTSRQHVGKNEADERKGSENRGQISRRKQTDHAFRIYTPPRFARSIVQAENQDVPQNVHLRKPRTSTYTNIHRTLCALQGLHVAQIEHFTWEEVPVGPKRPSKVVEEAEEVHKTTPNLTGTLQQEQKAKAAGHTYECYSRHSCTLFLVLCVTDGGFVSSLSSLHTLYLLRRCASFSLQLFPVVLLPSPSLVLFSSYFSSIIRTPHRTTTLHPCVPLFSPLVSARLVLSFCDVLVCRATVSFAVLVVSINITHSFMSVTLSVNSWDTSVVRRTHAYHSVNPLRQMSIMWPTLTHQLMTKHTVKEDRRKRHISSGFFLSFLANVSGKPRQLAVNVHGLCDK